MGFSAFIVELKDWQPVLGATLGFFALTWGALYNYKLGRKRDDAIREREAVAVSLGLYSEINLLSKELANLANSVGNWYSEAGYFGHDLPRHYSASFVLPEPTLFKALASKVGMLPTEVLMPITQFYGYYGEAVVHFPKILEGNETGISYGVEWVLDPAINAIEEVQSALRAIERIGGIADEMQQPCLSYAKNAKNLVSELRELQGENCD